MKTGQKVRNLQHMLNYVGISPGTVDGKFGQNTHNAVVRFHEIYGITQDGIVGPVTRAMLYMALGYDIPDPPCKSLNP